MQLVEGYELEPFKADLKSISRELSGRRRRIQELTKSYLISDEPTLVADAHELLNEADEVVSRGQKRIRRILQRLGMVLAGWQSGPASPRPSRRRYRWTFFLSSGDPEGTVKNERVPEPELRGGQGRICPEERETWRRYCGAWVEPRPMTVAGPLSKESLWSI